LDCGSSAVSLEAAEGAVGLVAQAETRSASELIATELLKSGCMFDETSNEPTPPKHPDRRSGEPMAAKSQASTAHWQHEKQGYS